MYCAQCRPGESKDGNMEIVLKKAGRYMERAALAGESKKGP